MMPLCASRTSPRCRGSRSGSSTESCSVSLLWPVMLAPDGYGYGAPAAARTDSAGSCAPVRITGAASRLAATALAKTTCGSRPRTSTPGNPAAASVEAFRLRLPSVVPNAVLVPSTSPATMAAITLLRFAMNSLSAPSAPSPYGEDPGGGVVPPADPSVLQTAVGSPASTQGWY